MKKLLLLSFIYLSVLPLIAQSTFNKAYHSFNEQAYPYLFSINSELYFVSQASNLHNTSWAMYRHSNTGQLKSRGAGYGFVNNVYKSLDNKLIVLGHTDVCDVIMPTQQNFITKRDTNTANVFNTTFTVSQGSNPKAGLQYIDSTYFVFTDSVLFKFSKSGNYLSKIILGTSSISAALLLPNTHILLSAVMSGSVILLEITPAGTLVTTNTIPVMQRKLSYYGAQKLLGLGYDNKLYKFSSTRALQGSSNFSGSAQVSDFSVSQDSIYTLLSSSANPNSYAVCDTSFNQVWLSSCNTNSVGQSAICPSGSKTAILSSGLSAPANFWGNVSKQFFVSLSVINKFSSNNFSSDLALLSVLADSSYVSCYYTAPDWHCSSNLRPRIKVKNKGTTIITSFKLNCFNMPAIDCGGYFYQEKFSGFVLQPGDSISLTANTFAIKTSAYIGASSSFTNDYCFYITVPNEETDKVVEDNQTCANYNFVVTSITNYSNKIPFISIAPNPFKDEINIESDSEIKSIELINSLGVSVKHFAGSSKEQLLDNSELPVGIYFLRIETDKGSATKKLLKN